jgi:hypothetical protein
MKLCQYVYIYILVSSLSDVIAFHPMVWLDTLKQELPNAPLLALKPEICLQALLALSSTALFVITLSAVIGPGTNVPVCSRIAGSSQCRISV